MGGKSSSQNFYSIFFSSGIFSESIFFIFTRLAGKLDIYPASPEWQKEVRGILINIINNVTDAEEIKEEFWDIRDRSSYFHRNLARFVFLDGTLNRWVRDTVENRKLKLLFTIMILKK